MHQCVLSRASSPCRRSGNRALWVGHARRGWARRDCVGGSRGTCRTVRGLALDGPMVRDAGSGRRGTPRFSCWHRTRLLARNGGANCRSHRGGGHRSTSPAADVWTLVRHAPPSRRAIASSTARRTPSRSSPRPPRRHPQGLPGRAHPTYPCSSSTTSAAAERDLIGAESWPACADRCR